MTSPADRIILIRQSLQVFVCGILGLLPVIGIFPAICAVTDSRRLSRRFRGEWNPAAPYVAWGLVVAWLSIGIDVIAGLILLSKVI